MNAPVNSLRILIVEDHPDTLAALRMYLEALGHLVSSATTLKGAVATLAETPCDLLLSDIGLPDGNGWELLQRLETSRPAFAVAMSGFGANADPDRSRAVGFRHHLVKPFHPAELDRIVSEVCQELSAGAARA
jgi:two-component system CheB/CheR fusion protein